MAMQTRRQSSMRRVRAFVKGDESVDYEHSERERAYAFVDEQLRRLGYRGLGERDKGTVRRLPANPTSPRWIRSTARSGNGGSRGGSRTGAVAAGVGRSGADTQRLTCGGWRGFPKELRLLDVSMALELALQRRRACAGLDSNRPAAYAALY